jgi:hypothetical protein
MHRFTVTVVAMIGSLLLGSAARAEDLVENPQYVSWTKHQPGSSVTMTMNTSSGGQSMTMTMTQTLVEVTDEAAVVEMNTEMDMAGQKHSMPVQQLKVEAKVPKAQADMTALPPGVKGEAKQVGNETVEIAGKSYDCEVIQFTGEADGVTSSGKIWRHDSIPGTVAKTEMKTEGPMATSVSMQVTSLDLK